ncbi:MAG: tRNA (cytidine(34)-2'-O)-methyltransferase [Bacteriovoracales bacterium]|nr:tRNA (cytidine(34)-2'-O)-methyltransferase [Bacteriovoracales bacterium]
MSKSSSPLFHIVLLAPEIPGNTGSIGRTCVALDIPLILIKPFGFDLEEKALRRAGLDYWKHLKLDQYESFEEFLEQRAPNSLSFYSKSAHAPFYKNRYEKGCYLVFGNETRGLPKNLFDNYPDLFYSLPMFSKRVRSLNLANAVTAVAYEGLRQISYKNAVP